MPSDDCASERGFQVGPQTVVSLSYDLYDAENEIIESSDDDSPLEVVFGHGQLAEAVERAIEGLEAGESTSVVLEPDEAFGPRDDAAVLEVERSELPPGAAPGDEFQAETEGGEPVALRVLEVTEATVVLDANHPLAGQSVRVDFTIEAVRPATDEELRVAVERLDAPEALVRPADLIRRDRWGYEKPPRRR